MTPLLGASEFRRALLASLGYLRDRRAAIDAANVYPVPDGDTGTNLVMTLEAVGRGLEGVPDEPGPVAHAVKTASLMGARGNSGVIVAQILRGLCEVLETGPADSEALARGLKRGTELAYEAVLAPAEGTILTVARAASEAAQGAHPDVATQLERIARAADEALAGTPKQLPVLAAAGVVDAGGMGLVAILEAFAAILAGREVPMVTAVVQVAPPVCDGPSLTYAHEVQYIVATPDETIPALRQLLGTIGDSVAVIGGDGLWRVHVHTDAPERAVGFGQAIGELRDVETVAFREQMAVAREAAAPSPGQRGVPLARAEQTASLVAVAAGDGARRLFAEMGAIVVDGGQTMNPSVGELLEAIRRAPADEVIVLPNNENVFATAGAAVGESSKHVTVLRSTDMAEGLAAAVAYGDARAVAANVADMQDAIVRVRTGQVVIAVRDAETPLGPVAAGQPLGFAEGSFVTASGAGLDDPVAVAVAVARALMHADAAVLTVLCGAEVQPSERARLTAALAQALGGLEIEVLDGGQPVHRYLLSLE